MDLGTIVGSGLAGTAVVAVCGVVREHIRTRHRGEVWRRALAGTKPDERPAIIKALAKDDDTP
jgi:hypothetical protein